MIQQIPDSMPELTCPYGNKARRTCISSKCIKNAFMCLKQECQCQVQHKTCLSYRLNTLLHQLSEKRQIANPQVIKACEQVKKIYDQLIDKLSLHKELIGDQMQLYGLDQNEAYLYKMLKEQRLSEVNGQIISKAMQNITVKLELCLTPQGVSKYWSKKSLEFQKMLLNLKGLMKSKWKQFDSVITDQTNIIYQFFDKDIAQINLLYRASQNNFAVSQFHAKCDGKQNTMVLAQTQFGKIIGGFTPLRWNSNGDYSSDTDPSNPTFLFSVSLNQSYKAISTQNVIYCDAMYGPTFGQGHDFLIINNSAKNGGRGVRALRRANSYDEEEYDDDQSYEDDGEACMFNFPTSFNNGKHYNGQKSYIDFAGSPSYSCRVTEWQVFQIQFK